MINKHLNMCQHDCTTCLFIVLQVFMKEFGNLEFRTNTKIN